MNSCLCLVLSVLSIWDYPLRQNAHDMLRRQFVVSMRKHDAAAMERICSSDSTEQGPAMSWKLPPPMARPPIFTTVSSGWVLRLTR